MRQALIWGVGGQDGSYLAELLLEAGYLVTGVSRRSSVRTDERIKHLLNLPHFSVVEGDLTDPSSVNYMFHTYKPDECYNLAAQSHVGTSFKQPALTWRVDAEGVLNILEAIRHYSPETRFYQASTSEMFGSNSTMGLLVKDGEVQTGVYEKGLYHYYQDEETPLAPNSPYAIAKVAAHHMVAMYREAYSIHASCGILFNHESERRGEEFVTRKITKWIGQFKNWKNQQWNGEVTGGVPVMIQRHDETLVFGIDDIHLEKPFILNARSFPKLRLGNLDAKRDWGHAEDYVKAMWLMLQQGTPDDYVIATGATYSIRQFLDEAFKCIGIDKWEDYVVIDPKFYRPLDVEYLLGRPTKAEKALGWERKVSFKDLVKRMVEHDVQTP